MVKREHVVDINAAFGMLGLLLMLVVARLARPAYAPLHGLRGAAVGFAARRVIDAIAAFGWVIDRLPLSTAALDPAAVRPARGPEQKRND